MQSPYARHLLHLLGTKIALLAAFLFMGLSPAQGQKFRGNFNYLDYQKKPYYFGITLGANVSKYRIRRSSEFLQSDSIQLVESLGGPGFNLGIVTNLKAGEFFDFRLLPTLSFTERTLRYGNNASEQDQRIASVFVEIPFHIRYKSAPFKDKRLYLVAGIKYGFDVAGEARFRQNEELVEFSPAEFSIEYGAGMQFFLPYFIFSPEIKISHGLGNTLIYDSGKEESRILQKLLSRTLTISFHFEG